MHIMIRNETPVDYRLVEEITREAFWNLYCPGCSEHFLAHQIRNHPDYLPDLSFVIERDGQVVGSIFYTRAKIRRPDGTEVKIVSFGPVSILPKFHRQGLGRALITHSITVAKKLGYQAIVIGGFPYHYQTYGFLGAKKYGISLPDGNYYTGILALPLADGGLDDLSGQVYFSEAMEVDEQQAAEFDLSFAPKEKSALPCQAEFALTVSQIDMADYTTGH